MDSTPGHVTSRRPLCLWMANLSYRYVCAIVLINFIDLCFLMTSIIHRASASSTSTRCLPRPRKCCLCTSLRTVLLFSTPLLHSFLFYAFSYLGAEFPKILDKKELVEYRQVNLTIPGTSCLAGSVSGSSNTHPIDTVSDTWPPPPRREIQLSKCGTHLDFCNTPR